MVTATSTTLSLFNPLCPCLESSQLWPADVSTPDIFFHGTVAFSCKGKFCVCAAHSTPTWRAYTTEQIEVLPGKILGCVLLCFYYKYTNVRYWEACRFKSVFEVLPFFQYLWKFKINQMCARALLSTQLLTLTPVPHSTTHKRDPGENLLKLNPKSHVKIENQVH